MKTIRLYHHPDCARCRKIAQIHRRMDWLDCVIISNARPPTGPLRLGQVAVEDLRTGRITKGAAAFEQLCRNIPAYAPGRLLRLFPAFRSYIEQSLNGCHGDACAV